MTVAYIESSVLTDWLFLDHVQLTGIRRVLGKETRDGYALIERILRRRYIVIEFVTSTWAVSESMQNYLRSFALFNMLFDNLSFRYYEVVRDYSRYKVANTSFNRLKKELMEKLNAAEKNERLSVVASTKKLDQSIHKYLHMGFDAGDAQHLVLAIDLLHAEYFITKDHDFTDHKSDLEKRGISVTAPSVMLKQINSWRT